VQHKRGGVILMGLSLLLLLAGGGFIPMFIGLMAGFAGSRIDKPLRRHLPHNARRLLASLWPWPLVAYFVWVFPAQWLLGHFFGAFVLNASLLLFFCFDLGLPLLTVFVALAHDNWIDGISQ
jgi:hypothetical protein